MESFGDYSQSHKFVKEENKTYNLNAESSSPNEFCFQIKYP